MTKEIKILGTATFGFRIGGDSWERGLSWDPDMIVGQGTSSDGGPAYLGSNTPYAGFMAIKEDLQTIIISAKERKIPFILSCGSPAGSNRELERALGAVDEIARKKNVKLKIAVIPGELGKEYLQQKIRTGAKIRRLVDTDRFPVYLTEQEVKRSNRIVAQMGPEPIIKAFEHEVDGVITGRALDVGLYMALPLKMGFNRALAAHMAKTIECSGLVTEPQSFEPVFAILKKDHFLIRPTSTSARCTVLSVASHAFYERPDPTREENPGGILDVSGAKYEQYDEQTVKVSGSRWITTPYSLKIEGVHKVGFRTICICGIRDEKMIRCIDWFLEQATKHCETRLHPFKQKEDYDLIFRIYGKDGVLGGAEPMKETKSHELGLIIDAVAKKKRVADMVCTAAVDFIGHMDYPGRLTTAGNVAFPYSPREHRLGPVYSYNIWHLLELDDPCEPFQIKIQKFPISS